jgi:hypothetical protein
MAIIQQKTGNVKKKLEKIGEFAVLPVYYDRNNSFGTTLCS